MERSYRCLSQQEFTDGKYKLTPIRDKDKYSIMQWRNEQINILRQKEPLTIEAQELYFKTVVNKLFEIERPNQLLFSFLEDNVLIGYGGLVHIDWDSRNGEISFITSTERNLNVDQFATDWIKYLKILTELVEFQLDFVKMYTYAYDIRPKLFEPLIKCDFKQEACLRKHVRIKDKMHDVFIHSYFCSPIVFEVATEKDLHKYFEWVNDSLVRQNSFNSNLIKLEDHRNWFINKINDRNSLLLKAISEGEVLGQIRFDKVSSDEYEVDFSVDSSHRGKGFGVKIVKYGVKQLRKHDSAAKRILARVKIGNLPSDKCFLKAGFELNKNENNVKGFSGYSFNI